jgi:hypothetical protein
MLKKHLKAYVLLMLGLLLGCGTGEYERRLEGRIVSLKTGSKFNILSPAIDIPGASLSIRIPQEFNITPLSEGEMLDGKPIDGRRVKPAVIDIPDLKATFEGSINDRDDGKQSYYLYVAVSKGANRGNLPKLMQADLASKFNNTSQLAVLQAPTPEGRSIDWQQCRGTGNQLFYYVLPPPGGEGQFRQMPGAVELLFHEENDALIILVWRMPTGIEGARDFKSWIQLVAGCVNLK